MSRYTGPGSMIIESDDTSKDKLYNVAFRNVSGDYVVVVRNPEPIERSVQIVIANKDYGLVKVPATGATTILFNK